MIKWASLSPPFLHTVSNQKLLANSIVIRTCECVMCVRVSVCMGVSTTHCSMLGWESLLRSSTSFRFRTPFILLLIFNTMISSVAMWRTLGEGLEGRNVCGGEWGGEGEAVWREGGESLSLIDSNPLNSFSVLQKFSQFCKQFLCTHFLFHKQMWQKWD